MRTVPTRHLTWSALALSGAALASGCGPDGGTLVLRFEHRLQDQPIELGASYATRYGQTVAFDHLRYWVSNLMLVSAHGAHYHPPDSYYLVEQTADNMRLEVDLSEVPADDYARITFHLGVDPLANANLDVVRGELRTGVGMEWSRDTGYKFFRTEGQFAEAGVEGNFTIHTGNDVLYKRLDGELPEPIQMTTGGRTELVVRAELNLLFAGIELSKHPDILGGSVDSLAGKAASNYARMFSLVTPSGLIAMQPSSPNLGGFDNGDIPPNGTPPSLTGPIIDLQGAMFCGGIASRPTADARACMTPFRQGAGSAYQDAGWFSFVTANGASVAAASPGIVADIVQLDHSGLTHSDLFSVAVRPSQDSAFWIEYRNLKDLRVSEGDEITVGQVLGGAGDYIEASYGIVSFGVRRQQELVQRLCPTRYMPGELVSAYQATLATSNAAWPAITHDGLCQMPALVCPRGSRCESPADFTAAQGDVDEGRRLYANACAGCHGANGEGGIGPRMCFGPSCTCRDCVDHATLAARIDYDMPPEGDCNAQCAADVAAFIIHAFPAP